MTKTAPDPSNAEPLRLPSNCIDVTERELGTVTAIIGARETYLKALAENPRFKEAPKSGQGTVIVGARKP